MYFSKKFHAGFPGKEKRRAGRFKLAKEFLVEFKKDGLFKKAGAGEGRDLSEEGVRFASPKAFKKGDHLEAAIYFSPEFPGTKKINLKAEVARCYVPEGARHYRVGCRFLHPDPAAREVIRQFLWWIQLEKA